MSVKLNYDTLSDDLKKYIYDNLVVKSKSTYKNKLIKKKNNDSDDIDSIIYCYNKLNNIINIPFYVSFQLFKLHLNNNKFYPQYKFNNSISLYDYQLDIYNTAISQLNTYNTTTLYIYTGSGKTRLCITLTSNMGYNTIVLVSNVEIAKQWFNNYTKLTNMSIWLVDGIKPPPPYSNVIICMDARLHYIPQPLLDSCGVLVVDEAHTFCTNLRIQTILKIQPKYIILATATLTRTDGLHKSLQMISGNHHIYRKSTKPFTVFKYYTGINVPIKYTYRKEPDFNSLLNDLCYNIERNKIILKIILDNPSYKILVMTRRVDHVKILYNVLKNNGHSVDCMYGTKKDYSDSRILIGSICKIGTGFDEESRSLNFNGIRINMLILVSTIKNESLLEQVVGRAFRSEYPYIVHLVDDIDIIKYSHWKIAQTWYTSRNGIIQEIYSDYYLHNKSIIESSVPTINQKIDPSILHYISTNS